MSSPSVLFVADVALARAASLYFRAIQPSVAGGWDRVCINQIGVRALWALEDKPYAVDRPASTVAHDVEEWSYQWLRCAAVVVRPQGRVSGMA